MYNSGQASKANKEPRRSLASIFAAFFGLVKGSVSNLQALNLSESSCKIFKAFKFWLKSYMTHPGKSVFEK